VHGLATRSSGLSTTTSQVRRHPYRRLYPPDRCAQSHSFSALTSTQIARSTPRRQASPLPSCAVSPPRCRRFADTQMPSSPRPRSARWTPTTSPSLMRPRSERSAPLSLPVHTTQLAAISATDFHLTRPDRSARNTQLGLSPPQHLALDTTQVSAQRHQIGSLNTTNLSALTHAGRPERDQIGASRQSVAWSLARRTSRDHTTQINGLTSTQLAASRPPISRR